MGKTNISWATKVWNPTTGCSHSGSPGCDNCWAKQMAYRLRGRCGYPADEPFRVTLHPERLDEPEHWKKPARIFVVSMGDLFHPDVPFEFVNDVFDTMWVTPRHTYMLLTKRPQRMLEYAEWSSTLWTWPWPDNIWCGVTAENQRMADERIPILLQIPAAVHFVSVEPMLGKIMLGDFFAEYDYRPTYAYYRAAYPGMDDKPVLIKPGLNWCICGSESGPNRRTFDVKWAEDLYHQCKDAGVPCFLKQDSAFRPGKPLLIEGKEVKEWPQ